MIRRKNVKENKKPLLIDIMYAKRKNTFNEMRTETKKLRDIDFS